MGAWWFLLINRVVSVDVGKTTILFPAAKNLHTALASLPVEERLKFAASLPPEERLKGLSAEEVVRGLSPETLEALARQLKANGHSSKPQ